MNLTFSYMVTSHLPQTISQQIERLNFPIPQVAQPESEEIKKFRSLLLDAHNRIRKIYDVPFLECFSNFDS